MIKLALAAAVLLQIGIAVSTEGLTRSLAELTAFLVAIALVLVHRSQSAQKEELTQPDKINQGLAEK
ncbi:MULTISPECIES: hypothetical protein [Vibrio]|uniref:O-succinylbenzoic acid--CoA ligase n=1 Tax=Vibrio campbellii (strain ATCC BAA-1116) TaxID=2902295 RepID=A7MV74_VIBC1|nr:MULTISPECIES: hypothetical protein [Vibrio]ABU70410.1 hypothetical protein VIBHAR_01435 [Vibrio campbellii ATCC BAA-1116]AGU96433.1 O-succinylbenzoic acid--CoA ligase [Vibrio campbellii ATCC BAA-1116]MBT0121363.1 hypothetical protein [Vibrio campbellii]MBT0136500.1 hypothetical protein [Vibrio campbellii]MBT0141100.1 hypothetical protein [Vibrio campbellii]